MDPEAAKRLHPNDHRKLQQALLSALSRGPSEPTSHTIEYVNRSLRPRYPPPAGSLIFWLDCDSGALKTRLDKRVDEMVKRGLIRELDNFLCSAAESMVPDKEGLSTEEGMFPFKYEDNYFLSCAIQPICLISISCLIVLT